MNQPRPDASDAPPFPRDPIAAATHPDPYPYYAALVARKPLYRDEALGLWVATSAAAVSAVLASDLCHVRPPAEPVPAALLGTPAGEIFRRLVRMNDGQVHARSRQLVGATVATIDGPGVTAEGRRWARSLTAEIAAAGADQGRGLPADFAFRLPVHVMGSLLGVPPDALPATAGWIGDFARCLAAPGDAGLVARGNLAAGHLLALFRSLPNAGAAPIATTAPAADTLATLDALDASAPAELAADADADAAALAAAARAATADLVAANRIGLLFQAYDATAGLLASSPAT